MHKLKDAVQRGSMLLGAVGLLVGIGASAMPALASADDTLNPLTNRSLMLSSSSPGWSFTDGSGNPTYAPPNSGANGKKTGNTFTFTQSTSGSVNALSFQYCTTAAGTCFAPGNDGYSGTAGSETRNSDNTTANSDLNVVTSSPTEISGTTLTAMTSSPRDTECLESDGTTQTNCGSSNTLYYPGLPASDGSEGNFAVFKNGTLQTGWGMTTENLEDTIIAPDSPTGVQNGDKDTGKQNLILLENATPISASPGDVFKVVFYGTSNNYITNPGSDAFFVKINDYDDTNTASGSMPYYTSTPVHDTQDAGDFGPASSYIVDGGVTVANVMNQSIQIQTKVLETMDFSVGTVDPDTLDSAQYLTAEGTSTVGACEPILGSLTGTGAQNELTIGNEQAENSLSTSSAFATHSYWRLSSNSSGGATVYYSGNTLSNTEGNQIAPIGDTAASSDPSNEQFGLALDTNNDSTNTVSYATAANDTNGVVHENGADTDASITGLNANFTSPLPTGAHDPQLYPLEPEGPYTSGTDAATGPDGLTQYGSTGAGAINSYDSGWGTSNAEFAYSPKANTIPEPIATESSTVVNCATGKMRYLANIAATTAAGIYTTKINYVAAPEY